MVRIEEKRLVIEIPAMSRKSAVEDLALMTDGLLHLIQTADGELMSDEERYTLMELLRAMLPKFECGSCGVVERLSGED